MIICLRTQMTERQGTAMYYPQLAHFKVTDCHYGFLRRHNKAFPKQQNKEKRAPYYVHDVTSYTHSSLLHKRHHHCPVHHWHQFKYQVNHLTSIIVTSGLGNILTLPGYWNVMTFSLPNRVFVQVSTITFSLSPA